MQAIVGDMIRFDRAKEIADNVLEVLKPSCQKIMIAGSIRRERDYVKDIEIVCLPNKVQELLLFTTLNKDINCYEFVNEVCSLGEIKKGNPNNGRYVKIEHFRGGITINIDLFIPQEHDFGRIAMIRTGSRDYVVKMMQIARRKGWVGTSDGLRLEEQCIRHPDKKGWIPVSRNPTLPPPFYTEESFYEFLNVPFLLPKFREV